MSERCARNDGKPSVGRRRIRALHDPGDRRLAALDDVRRCDAAAGEPADEDARAAHLELGRPPVAVALDVGDHARDLDEPPLDGRGRRRAKRMDGRLVASRGRERDSARRRGAPHASPTVPVARTRVPTRNEASGAARYSSIAAVPSSRIVRRPLASRSAVLTVSVPSTVTGWPWRSSAFATDIACGRGDPSLGLGVRRRRGAWRDGDGAGVAVITTSARSRSHRR